jgi:hypothetical protein
MSSDAKIYIAVQLVLEVESPHGLLFTMVLSLDTDVVGLGDLLRGVFSAEGAHCFRLLSFVLERLWLLTVGC